MQGPDEVRIETPEQIDLALEPAGLGSRFVAWVVDSLIWSAVLLFAALVLGLLARLVGFSPRSQNWAPALVLALALIYLLLVAYGNFFELRWNGQTPGKRLADLRVIREGGAPIDFRSSCIRNLLRPVDIVPLFYGVGTLTALLTARRQRLGDLAAGTLVIRERALAPPADPAAILARFASGEMQFTAHQVQACAPGDRHVLRSYFDRHEGLEARARRRLATRLAQLFAERVGYPPDGTLTDLDSAEKFLASLYRDLDTWARHGRK
jgi:uncharacterized RDD family membrane protein YckC